MKKDPSRRRQPPLGAIAVARNHRLTTLPENKDIP